MTLPIPAPQKRQPSGWAVARVFSKRAHRISRELEESGIGTFQPTYVRKWYSDGKLSTNERPLLPGYMLVQVGENWGAVGAVDGVYGLLTNAGRVCAVRGDEMARLMIAHATGQHDEIERPAEVERVRRRRRRPRPGRRARMRFRQVQPNTGA